MSKRSESADASLETLRKVLGKYSNYDIAVPFYGLATRRMPVFHANVTAMMRGDLGQRQGSADEYRMDTLAKVHAMVAEVEQNLWIRTDAISIEFTGSLIVTAVATLDMKLVRRPVEANIGCRVRLQLDRMDGVL